LALVEAGRGGDERENERDAGQHGYSRSYAPEVDPAGWGRWRLGVYANHTPRAYRALRERAPAVRPLQNWLDEWRSGMNKVAGLTWWTVLIALAIVLMALILYNN
jgi:hypothetical protein